MKINRDRKPLIAIASAMLLMLALITAAWADKAKTQASKTPVFASQEKAKKNLEEHSLIDQNGREVKVPEQIKRVVLIPLPFPSLYYVVTGSCKGIVGIHPDAKSNVRTSMLGVLAPGLMHVATGFVKGKDINIEELLKLRPDIIFFWGLFPNQTEQFDAIAIPAVAVHTIKGGDALATLHSWITLLGKIFGEKERTSELIADNYNTMDMISSRVRDIPRGKKPKALILFYHSAKQICVGRGNYGQFWLESTGAMNAAEDIPGVSPVNMEQIYEWNPDIIYISNFSNTMPEDILNNTIEGQNWSVVKAVRDKRVYKIPSGIYRWDPPSADASLMLRWMAKKHHPEIFADYTMGEEIRNHYSRFYHYNLSSEQIEGILHRVQ